MKVYKKLIELEQKGIDYHTIVSKLILDKLDRTNLNSKATSVLVYGDKDLLISSLLAQKFLIHVTNTGNVYPTCTHRIKPVEMDTFPLYEYDIIIGLFCDKDFITKCIGTKQRFFLIPEFNSDINLNVFTRQYLKDNNIDFKETVIHSYMSNNLAFYNI